MTNLDINTPRGQQTLDDEAKAVSLFEERFQGWKYIHTDKKTMAKVDAILLRDGTTLAGLVLTSCRYKCSLSTYELNWNWEWLLTWRKLAIGALLSRHLQTPLIGFLYIVNDDLLLVKRLFDPLKNEWAPMRCVYDLETQATCNGGKIVRKNALIKIDKAVQLRRS